MTQSYRMLLAAVVLAAMSLPAMAADEEERTDRVVFNGLVRELNQTHREYATVYQRGVNEARENDGSASLSTRAEILSLRDEIDRKMNRLMLIALRHGWDVPTFDLENPGTPEPAVSRSEEVFSSADSLIRSAFAAEARQLAEVVRLPVVSIQGDKG